MLNFSEIALMAFAQTLTVALVRLSGFFLTAPLLSMRGVPRRARALIILVLAFVVASTVESTAVGAPGQATISQVAAEFAVGALMGFAVRMAYMAFDLAGELLSQQAGLNFAQANGLELGSRELPIGSLLALFATAIGFATNLHLVLIEAVVESYRVVPFGSLPDVAQPAALMALVAHALRVGTLLALPALIFLMIANMLQAALGRASPQFGQFAVGFSVTIVVALAALLLLLPALGAQYDAAVRPALELIRWTR
jgi:flagellar biosynthetic protein FliR